MSWTFPNVYVVKDLETGVSYPTRHDQFMFEDRIQSDIHYRELYEHRLVADKYEYPETLFAVQSREEPERVLQDQVE